MADSGPVIKVAFAAAAETAAPTPLPAQGAAIDWTAEATWPVTIGCTDLSDDANLQDAEVSYTPVVTGVDVHPPLCLAPQATYVRKNGGGVVSFEVYDVTQAVFELDSTSSTTDNTTERSATLTMQAMCVEVAGKGIDWYPNVRVKVTGHTGGPNTVAGATVEVQVYAGATVPSGVQWQEFNG